MNVLLKLHEIRLTAGNIIGDRADDHLCIFLVDLIVT